VTDLVEQDDAKKVGKKMKAIVHEGKIGLEGLVYREMPERRPGPGEVRVNLKTAGLNYRDLLILNRHLPAEPPFIVGSDGAGIISAVGPGVTRFKTGDEVMINPALGWLEKSGAAPDTFSVLGYPRDGTFAEAVIVPDANVVIKPEYLTWEEAGVFSLAALTAYRVLFTKGRLTSGMKVLIPGIGGGVATFLLFMAKAAGARVYVTSRTPEKRKRAIELGADIAIDSQGDWQEALVGERMDLVIESVGASTFHHALDQLRPGGTMVAFGASTGDVVSLNLRRFFYGQFQLLGSTMGSAEEYQEMIRFVQEHQIRPVVDQMFPLHDYGKAFDRMAGGRQFGKIGFWIGA